MVLSGFTIWIPNFLILRFKYQIRKKVEKLKKKFILLSGLALAIIACVGSKEGGKIRGFPVNGSVAIKEEKTELSQETIPATDTNETEEKRETHNPEEADTSQETDSLCVGKAKEIYDATNAERVAAGLPELVWSDELAEAADVRAGEIIDDFSHVRPDGTKCYVLCNLIYGENIARGPHATGEEFVSRWMDSEGHRANILCCQYTLIGVGTRCTERGDTAVQLFGCED